jgi:hypothetical protein
VTAPLRARKLNQIGAGCILRGVDLARWTNPSQFAEPNPTIHERLRAKRHENAHG